MAEHATFLTDEEARTRDAAIVIDIGTDSCRIGFSNSNWDILQRLCRARQYPLTVPVVVGRPKSPNDIDQHLLFRDSFVGSSAQSYREICDLVYPVERGTVMDWDTMEFIWQYIFDNELHALPKDFPVVFTEPVLSSRASRERATQIFFETFDAPNFFIGSQPVMTCYAYARSSGLVVDVGEGITDIVPVYDGNPVHSAIRRIKFAGQDFTAAIARSLNESGQTCTLQEARKIKESRRIPEVLCTSTTTSAEGSATASLNPFDTAAGMTSDVANGDENGTADADMMNAGSPQGEKRPEPQSKESEVCNPQVDEATYSTHVTPLTRLFFEADRQAHTSASHGADSASALTSGIHQAAYYAIMSCDREMREALFQNIILCGGTCSMPGFSKKFEEKFRSILPGQLSSDVRFTSLPDYMPVNSIQYSSWHGAAIIASAERTLQQMWVSKQEYNDFGPTVIWK